MGMPNWFARLMVPLLIERPAAKKRVADFAAELGRSGIEVQRRVNAAKDSEGNRKLLRHIIGLERWGQRRLKVFLGEPLVMDAHHPYKPEERLAWDALLSAFEETRLETISLAERLDGQETKQKVPHNQMGLLSAKGWLRYLDMHASFESKRFK